MTGRAPHADMDEIRRALALLFEPGQVVELRALDVPEGKWAKTWSGYFDDMELLSTEATKLSGRAKGIYVTVNVIDPALLSRRANRVEGINERDSTTGDSHVLRRRWLVLDFDATHVSGVSSTEEEHQRAIERARLVREHLRGLGWPEPILADSGNGAHLLYRVDLPREDQELVKLVLEALHEQFGDDGVAIDRAVFNPARIWKLYGTLCRKGDDTPERPHRTARLLDVPETLTVVRHGLLAALAATSPKAVPGKAKPTTAKASRPQAHRFDLAGWIAKHALDVTGPEEWQGGQMWVFRTCPWNLEHTNRSAWVAQLPNGALSAGCHHDGCTGLGWADLKRLYAVDEMDDVDAPSGGSQSKSQASKVVRLVEEAGEELWHTPEGDPYMTVVHRGHREHYSLKSSQADRWLRRCYYEATGGAIGSQPLSDALNLLRSKALFDGDKHDVFVRIGVDGEDFYVDLGDRDWRAVRISDRGWEIATQPPIRFRRPKGMRPLPEAVHGGAVVSLRRFMNIGSEDDFRLLLSVMAACFWPTGPYPVLILNGEQGSAKSTAARILRALLDPNSTPLRAQPRDGRDLMITATNSWVVAMDNLSDIVPWLSDALCRLATGGGFSTRELFSDGEEVLFEAQRPVILNGIEELASRGDLLDRAIVLVLPAISETERMDEETFWAAFEEAIPEIFGALLDAVVVAKRNVKGTRLRRMPRLADFARRGAAVAPALGWTAEAFLAAYADNRVAGHAGAIEGSALARALTDYLGEERSWKGTASSLLEELNRQVGEAGRRDRHWPKSPLGLANGLRRLVPNLRVMGIDVTFSREKKRGRARLVTIGPASPEAAERASTASTSSSADSESVDALLDDSGERPTGASPENRFRVDAPDDADASDAMFTGWEHRPAESAEPPRPNEHMPFSDEFWRCPACIDRPAPEGGLCFRCAAAETELYPC